MKKFFSRLFGGLSSISSKRTPNDPRRYRIQKRLGQGAFGSVWEAEDRVTGELVAIKKVRIGDDGNAEHELCYSSAVSHKNVIRLLGHFREKSKQKDLDKPGKKAKHADTPPMDMCLVLEYTRTTLRDCIDDFRKKGKVLPNHIVMLLTFQMYRGLHYLHSLGIIHRDLKPSNLLIDKSTFVLKISDLGHAVRMIPGEPRDTRACSVPYRAPELELANEDYHEKIDIWSSGCVVAECYTGEILFREVKNVRHYDRIRELLGDPSLEDMAELQPLITDPPAPRYPSVFDQRFASLKPHVPEAATALVKKCLTYKPSRRPSAIELCADAYYDELREASTFDALLYDFSDDELANVASGVIEAVVPARCRNDAVLRKLLEGRQERTTSTVTAKSTGSSPSVQSQQSGGKKGG